MILLFHNYGLLSIDFNQNMGMTMVFGVWAAGLERLKGVKSYKQDHNPTDISLQRDTAKVVKDVGSPETFSEANTFQRTKGYRYSSNEVLTDTKDMRGLVKEYDTNGQRLLTPAVTQARETRFAGKVKLFSPGEQSEQKPLYFQPDIQGSLMTEFSNLPLSPKQRRGRI